MKEIVVAGAQFTAGALVLSIIFSGVAYVGAIILLVP